MVVSLISLLMLMVIPALTQAAEFARHMQCRSALSNLGLGMLHYSGDYDGWLPSGPIELSQWPGNPDRGAPNEVYDLRRTANPGLTSISGWYGMGLLWKLQFIDGGNGFYCPQADHRKLLPVSRAWPASFYADHDPADGKTRIYSSFVYRGGLASHAGTSQGPLNTHRQSGRYGVAADDPCFGRSWHETGYNVLNLDQSVSYHDMDPSPVPQGQLPIFWQNIHAWWTSASLDRSE